MLVELWASWGAVPRTLASSQLLLGTRALLTLGRHRPGHRHWNANAQHALLQCNLLVVWNAGRAVAGGVVAMEGATPAQSHSQCRFLFSSGRCTCTSHAARVRPSIAPDAEQHASSVCPAVPPPCSHAPPRPLSTSPSHTRASTLLSCHSRGARSPSLVLESLVVLDSQLHNCSQLPHSQDPRWPLFSLSSFGSTTRPARVWLHQLGQPLEGSSMRNEPNHSHPLHAPPTTVMAVCGSDCRAAGPHTTQHRPPPRPSVQQPRCRLHRRSEVMQQQQQQHQRDQHQQQWLLPLVHLAATAAVGWQRTARCRFRRCPSTIHPRSSGAIPRGHHKHSCPLRRRPCALAHFLLPLCCGTEATKWLS
jgi:hypothetical protein